MQAKKCPSGLSILEVSMMRKAWSALLLLLFTAESGNAQIIPLPDLTQALLRERIQLFLRTAEARTLLNPITRLVRLRADQIAWEGRAGRPTRLIWAYEATRELSERERIAVEEVLRGVLRQIFSTFRGGLLSEEDRTAVFAVTRFTPAAVPLPQPYPQPETPPAPSTPPSAGGGGARASSAQPATVWYNPSWYYPCGYYPCGGYWYWPPLVSSYYYPVVVAAPAPVVAVASASSPARVSPPTDGLARELMLIRSRKATDPELLYRQARTSYWQGDSEAARELLTRAIELDAQDARFWYFRALAERALGDQTAARASAERGAALEMLHKPSIATIGLALERVQGADRWFLRHAVDRPLTAERAAEIVRAPLPPQRIPAASDTRIASSPGR
jgi:hypothetical protein